MDLWDLYDKDRKPLGILHKRGEPLKRGTYHLAVGIWTVNSKNELLITLRDKAKKEWPSLWENTAGSVLSGESSRQGAVRELFEETGIRANEDEMVLIGTERTRNAFGDCYAVRKDVPIDNIVFQSGETCDAKWVSLSTLDEMIEDGLVAPPVANRLAKIRKDLEKFIFTKDEE